MALDLNRIIGGDSNEIKELKRGLKRRGWQIVVMPSEMTKLVTKCIDPMKTFFERDLESKTKYNYDHIFGYTNVDHKESFRWITGDRFDTTKLPKESKKQLIELTKYMDKFMLDLATSICTPIFNMSSKELGRTYDLPLLNNRHWAMLDIAHYLNDPSIAGPSSGDNCEPHVDPGLISLSVLSTAPGLELFDPKNNKWIPHDNTSDKTLGIIWCGTAAKEASKGKIKAGLHKVVRYSPDGNGKYPKRMAMWYEICTYGQDPNQPYSKYTEYEFNEDELSKALLAPELYSGIPITKTEYSPRDHLDEIIIPQEISNDTSIGNKRRIQPQNNNTSNTSNNSIPKSNKKHSNKNSNVTNKMLIPERRNGVPITKSAMPKKLSLKNPSEEN